MQVCTNVEGTLAPSLAPTQLPQTLGQHCTVYSVHDNLTSTAATRILSSHTRDVFRDAPGQWHGKNMLMAMCLTQPDLCTWDWDAHACLANKEADHPVCRTFPGTVSINRNRSPAV